MIASYQDAEDELFTAANAAYQSAIVGVSPAPYAELVTEDEVVDLDDIETIYGRIQFVVVNEQQSSFVGSQAKALYETVGLLTVQLYGPKSDVTVLRSLKRIAEVIKNQFCNAAVPGDIWFTRQRSTPVNGNEVKNQVNVVITCTYTISK